MATTNVAFSTAQSVKADFIKSKAASLETASPFEMFASQETLTEKPAELQLSKEQHSDEESDIIVLNDPPVPAYSQSQPAAISLPVIHLQPGDEVVDLNVNYSPDYQDHHYYG